MITSRGSFFGKPVVIACDGRCGKAFGFSLRPRIQWDDDPDDITWLSDGEIPYDAPDVSGDTEGGEDKPPQPVTRHNKWCVRNCERSQMFGPDEEIVLRDDWSGRVDNMRGKSYRGKDNRERWLGQGYDVRWSEERDAYEIRRVGCDDVCTDAPRLLNADAVDVWIATHRPACWEEQ